MTPHVNTMAAPEAIAADIAILNVAAAVAKAATAIADARTAIVEMEIALAAYTASDGSCGCGCS
jgi:hypothetical protein